MFSKLGTKMSLKEYIHSKLWYWYGTTLKLCVFVV